MIGALLALSVCSVIAEKDSVFGTHWVRFEPLQIEGQLKGCSLVYLAVQADWAYLNGSQIAVNGAIQVTEMPPGLPVLIFKIGLRNMSLPGSSFISPTFAYIQTDGASTAAATQRSMEGEAGYGLFVYNFDSQVAKVLGGLIDGRNVSIGFNRKKGGTDVIVPLDFSVVDSEYTESQKVIRKHSSASTVAFADCVLGVIEMAQKTHQKVK
jgi:hypothetical protein